MGYRRSLFQIEQWSPFLARKIWALTPFFDSPFIIALGLKIKNLTDSTIEIAVPYSVQNRNEWGEINSTVLVAAAQLASQMLWKRHIRADLEEMFLTDFQSRFQKPAKSKAFVRAELAESERESILRKLRNGETTTHDMSLIVVDNKDQSLAQMNCIWRFRPLRPLTISGGE